MLESLKRWLEGLGRHEPVYYFFHIPKTAGTSLRVLLEQQFTGEEVCQPYYIAPLMQVPREEMKKYRLFRGHYYNLLFPLVPRRLTTFTFLRDPIERSLSHYEEIRRAKTHYFHHKVQEQGSLLRFLEDPETRPMIANFQARSLLWNPDPRRLASRFSPAELESYALERTLESDLLAHLTPRKMFERARKRLDSFAFVGVTERFEESLSRMFAQFGWPAPPPVHRENVSQTRTWQADLTPRERALLEELTEVDRQLHAYALRRLGS